MAQLHSPVTSDVSEPDASSWCSNSEASYEDSNEHEVDSLADEEYWEENVAADAWLARNPGGIPFLYPQLFVVKPRKGNVVSPSHHSNRTDSFLLLPSEIRNRIYQYYLDSYTEVKRPEEWYAPFRDRDGKEIQRICLSSENIELKFSLSTALLQTSRQVRSEAMIILFKDRVITMEWLPVLPRFVEFLGRQGCEMVRYLDIWDSLNCQENNSTVYQDILTSIKNFTYLQHLRIVLSYSNHNFRLRGNRISSWFDVDEWTPEGFTTCAVPKMRSENLESHWPEYEVLKTLKAQQFTLAVTTRDARYIEFDRNYGAYPGISELMQSNPIPTLSEQSLTGIGTFSENQKCNCAFTPSTEVEDQDGPTWQDTDTLANNTIPLYNFVRKYFHDALYLEPLQGEVSRNNFITFPTARLSTGSIMRDCALCYLSEFHCGNHAVPDQPPFEPRHREGESMENSEILEKQFHDLSYLDMREACRVMARRTDQAIVNGNATTLFNVFAVLQYRGWFETPSEEILTRLDAAVEVGWTGKMVDKNEVPPWNVLYREFKSFFGPKKK